MISFFKELFEYNHHFNQQLETVFTKNRDKVPEKSARWFSHILNAHHIWNSRILSEANRYSVWQIHNADEFGEIDRDNYAASLKILDQVELETAIKYVTSKGEPFTNSTRDILFHIVNHSTYHRGQIAADFRQHNIEPVVTDYVFYKR